MTPTPQSFSLDGDQHGPRGQATWFTYDFLNRLTQIADTLAGLTRFAYDGNGNLLTVTDARGNAVSHTYDSIDRLATRTDPVGAIHFSSPDAKTIGLAQGLFQQLQQEIQKIRQGRT